MTSAILLRTIAIQIYRVLGTSVLTEKKQFDVEAAEVAKRAASTSQYRRVHQHRARQADDDSDRHVYTGQFQGELPRQEQDMLVVSAMQGLRHLQRRHTRCQLIRKAGRRPALISIPRGYEQGTPWCGTRPRSLPSTILTFEDRLDEFPDEILNKTQVPFRSGRIRSPPGERLPLLASTVVKLAAGLGQGLFDGKPVFTATESIDLRHPGCTHRRSGGFRIICGPDARRDEFQVRTEARPGLRRRQGSTTVRKLIWSSVWTARNVTS